MDHGLTSYYLLCSLLRKETINQFEQVPRYRFAGFVLDNILI